MFGLFHRRLRLALACTLAALATGCAMQAPRYQPSLDNAEAARKLTAPLAIGAFTVQAGGAGVTAIGLRGSSMTSPVGADYAAYLADALQQELQLAGKLDAKSKIVITGVLVKNDIAAGGFSTNSGEIEASFIVLKDGKEVWRGSQRAELSWDSSFVGAIAIPKAQQQYPLVVRKLISQLFTDAGFIAALK